MTTLKEWLFGPSLIVYVGTKMSGRDKLEMVERARFVVKVLESHGITAISPVLKEEVKAEAGRLINHDKEKLKKFWADDKYIIRRVSHAVLFDKAEMSSFGMTREYSLNRGVLWKPTVTVVEDGTALSVAPYEDDSIHFSVQSAGALMARMW